MEDVFLRCIYAFLFSVILSHAANNWKYLSHDISDEKKIGSAKYPRKRNLDPRNTHGKISWRHETPTRRNLWPTKYPERHDGTMALDPQDPRDPGYLAHSFLMEVFIFLSELFL